MVEQVIHKLCPTCGTRYESEVGSFCAKDGVLLAPIVSDPLIGSRIANRYDVQELVGVGGWGKVYKCWDTVLKRNVAAKTLFEQFTGDAERVRRFQQEAEATSSINSPNVCAIYDYGMLDNGQPYLVIEFIAGQTLSEILYSEHPISLDRVLSFSKQIMAALKAAHARGIIHRDLKPSNLIVSKSPEGEETLKIVDFGLAKLLDSTFESGQPCTRTGETVGTPEYMSPEQCEGLQVDARSDIYSAACIIYQMLAGKPPFVGDTMMATMYRQFSEAPTPLTTHRANTPIKLESVVFKGLEKHPARRHQSASEMLSEFESIDLTAKTTVLRRMAQRVMRNPRSKIIAVSTTAILVAGIGTTIYLTRPAPPSTAPPTVSAVSAPAGTPLFRSPSTALAQKMEDFDRSLATHDWVKAEEKGSKLLEDIKTELGENHPILAEAYTRQGIALSQQEKHAQALPLIEKGLVMKSALAGENDPSLFLPNAELGRYCFMNSDYPRAERYFKKALQIREKAPGIENDGIAMDVTQRLATSLNNMHRRNEAQQVYAHLLSNAQKKYPADHPVLHRIKVDASNFN